MSVWVVFKSGEIPYGRASYEAIFSAEIFSELPEGDWCWEKWGSDDKVEDFTNDRIAIRLDIDAK